MWKVDAVSLLSCAHMCYVGRCGETATTGRQMGMNIYGHLCVESNDAVTAIKWWTRIKHNITRNLFGRHIQNNPTRPVCRTPQLMDFICQSLVM